jgi:hypothetical protein
MGQKYLLLVLMCLEYLPCGTDGLCIVYTIARIITNLDKLFPARCAHILELGHKQLLGCQPHLGNIYQVRNPEKNKDNLLDFVN